MRRSVGERGTKAATARARAFSELQIQACFVHVPLPFPPFPVIDQPFITPHSAPSKRETGAKSCVTEQKATSETTSASSFGPSVTSASNKQTHGARGAPRPLSGLARACYSRQDAGGGPAPKPLRG